MLTFEPHPLRVLHPEAAPKLIMPFEIKRDVIEGLGVEELIVIPFDDEFSTIAAEDFCSQVLVQALGARSVSVGENFRFGAKARGDDQMLASRDEFETRVVPLVEVDGEIVSSTRVRSLVAAGEIEAATRCLGAPFLLEGTVVEGDERGRKLGFPTANIVPSDDSGLPWPRRLRGVRRRPSGRRQRGRAADLRDRAGVARRGVPDRLRRGPVRADAADRVHQPAARRTAVRRGGGADRSDAPGRRDGPRALC